MTPTKKNKIDPTKTTKEGMILYYLFIDEQLLCAWWDYLEIWDCMKEPQSAESSEYREKILQTMNVVEYWEEILDELKKHITYEDIEDYIRDNPNVKKSYLFMRT
jgi:hypothetical protein